MFPIIKTASVPSAVSIGTFGEQSIVVSGHDDSTVCLWDPLTGQQLESLTGHHDWVSSIIVAKKLIVSGSGDGTIRLWDPLAMKQVGIFTNHTSGVNSITLKHHQHADPRIVSASYDGTVRVWNPITGREEYCFIGRCGFTSVTTCYAGGETVIAASGDNDCAVHLWNLHSGWYGKIRHHDEVSSVSAWPKSSLTGTQSILVSASHDGIVRLWNPLTGQQLGDPLVGHRGWVVSVDTGNCHGLPIAVSAGHDHTVRIWNLINRRQVQQIGSHLDNVTHAVIGNDPVVVSAGYDKTIRITDII